MAVFRYRACDDSGAMTSGQESADSRSEVLAMLMNQHLHPIEVKPVEADAPPPTVEETLARFLPVPRQGVADLFDQLATLLDAGIPIIEALRGVTEQESNLRIREAMKRVCRRVEDGMPLYSAMASVSAVFDETCVRVVKAGEQSGKLVPVLIRLSQTIEFDLTIRKKFKEATRYPKMVVGTLILTAGLLLTFVVPRYANLFAKAEVDLPISTYILVVVGDVVGEYWMPMVCAVLLLYAVNRLVLRDKGLSTHLDSLRMRIPIWGVLQLKIEMSRSFKILSLLIESGVNILNAFQLVSGITRNGLLTKAYLRVRDRLEHGESVATALQDIPLFPKAARQMIVLGERAGRLDESLDKISQMYERDTTASIKRMTSMVEPALIVGIGGIVIIFALSIFLPMWDLIKVVR